MKKYLPGFFFAIVLCLFTGYVLLDVFLIPHVYLVVEPENTKSGDGIISGEAASQTEQNQMNPEQADAEESVIISTDTEYQDDHIHIVLTQYREYDTDIYVADILIDDIGYLKTAFAQNSYGKNVNEKTSVIAQECDALLAINGDFYGAREKGYVLRNGISYRDDAVDEKEDLAILQDGSFYMFQETQYSLAEIEEMGAWQVLSFGPILIQDNRIKVGAYDEVDIAMQNNPRTVIGYVEPGHYILMVGDGRSSASEGLKLVEAAQFMQSLGVTECYNLDGGGSATMVFQGKVVNQPTTNGTDIKERRVSDIVYIGY